MVRNVLVISSPLNPSCSLSIMFMIMQINPCSNQSDLNWIRTWQGNNFWLIFLMTEIQSGSLMVIEDWNSWQKCTNLRGNAKFKDFTWTVSNKKKPPQKTLPCQETHKSSLFKSIPSKSQKVHHACSCQTIQSLNWIK